MDIRLAGTRDGIDAAIEIFETLGIRCIFATAHADPGVRSRAEKAVPLGLAAKAVFDGVAGRGRPRRLAGLWTAKTEQPPIGNFRDRTVA